MATMPKTTVHKLQRKLILLGEALIQMYLLLFTLIQCGHGELDSDGATHITDMDMDTDGVILIMDGDIQDTTRVGVIQVITLAMVTDTTTTLTTMEEEDLLLITDQEDILQEAHTILVEIMPEEETIPQTETAILQIETATLLTDVQTTLTLEEPLTQTAEATQQARLSQTEEGQHKAKATIMITEDLAQLQTEVTTIPIVTRQDHTLLAHLAQ